MDFADAVIAKNLAFEDAKQRILASADEVAAELTEALLPEDLRAAGLRFAFELGDPQ
ncbi:hypothetical protein ACFV20_19145 [Streptomyces sp. NPDC059696]|uniref:hypothetical protein n=1 Tax=Streptomyces sp. NPDC059696 TaxID=3346911 RepID=UPI00367B11EA